MAHLFTLDVTNANKNSLRFLGDTRAVQTVIILRENRLDPNLELIIGASGTEVVRQLREMRGIDELILVTPFSILVLIEERTNRPEMVKKVQQIIETEYHRLATTQQPA
jgi:hypothetical protein